MKSIKEESLLWLCCLFQFQIQSFVLNCFFSLWSRVTPLLTIYWLSPAGSSILIGWGAHRGGFGRYSFVYMLVEKNPNNNCYLGQPDNLQLARQTDTQGCKLILHAHTMYNEVTRCPNAGQMKSLCSLWFFALWLTWLKIHSIYAHAYF